jgi:hypothetical protein
LRASPDAWLAELRFLLAQVAGPSSSHGVDTNAEPEPDEKKEDDREDEF